MEVAYRVYRLIGHAHEYGPKNGRRATTTGSIDHWSSLWGSQVILSIFYLHMLEDRNLGAHWIGPFHVAAYVRVVAYWLGLPS